MKLQKRLEKLKPKEVRTIRHFLSSPIYVHHNRDDVKLFFELFLKEIQKEKGRKLSKEQRDKIWKQVPGNLPEKSLIYFLNQAINWSLILSFLDEEKATKEQILKLIYKEKKFVDEKFYFEKIYNDKGRKAFNVFIDLYQEDGSLAWEKIFPKHFNKTIEKNLIFQYPSDAYDKIILKEKLRQGCVMLSHQRTYSSKNRQLYDLGLAPIMVEFLDSRVEILEAAPELRIYYYAFKFLENENDHKTLIDKIEKLLFSKTELTSDCKRDIGKILINYYTKYPDSAGFQKQLKLYKELSGLLNPTIELAFNFITICCINGQANEAKYFLDQCTNLSGREFKLLSTYLKARAYFENRNFEAAEDLLSELVFKDQEIDRTIKIKAIELNIYLLLIICYFELGEEDSKNNLVNRLTRKAKGIPVLKQFFTYINKLGDSQVDKRQLLKELRVSGEELPHFKWFEYHLNSNFGINDL